MIQISIHILGFRVGLMRLCNNFISIFCAVFLLIGCSYSHETYQGMATDNTPPVERIELTPPESAAMDSAALFDAASRASDRSVEIYPLDGPVSPEAMIPLPVSKPVVSSPPMEVGSVKAVPVGRASHAYAYDWDSSVEVFPLDGEMERIIAPGLMPKGHSRAPSAPAEPFPYNKATTTRGIEYTHVQSGGDSLAVVYFTHDSAALTQAGRQTVREVAAHLGPGDTVSVEGHASVQSSLDSPLQRKAVNLKVSMARAFAVAKALMDQGVPAEDLEVKAYGETRLPAPPPGMTREEASRRVEIYDVSVQ